MKRYALVALTAMTLLSACTALNPERRTLTQWNLDLLSDTNHKVEGPKDSNAWSDTAYPVIDWVLVQPIQAVMLPVSWSLDTFVLNPINAWKKAELDTHRDREGRYMHLQSDEAAVKNYQYAPMVPPPIVSDLLDAPRFLARWLWNSTYWADPVDSEAYDNYWERHYEKTARSN